MDKKKIGIIVVIALVLAALTAGLYVYRQGDHRGPELTMVESYQAGYGERIGLYDVVRAVSDENTYELRITAGGDVSADGRSTVFERSGPAAVEVTAVDEFGNRTVKSADITVVDAKPPVIQVEALEVDLGERVDFRAGVSASDEMDGNLTAAVQVDTSAVDETRAGVYPVVYSVTDAAGNEAVLRAALTIRSPEARAVSLNRQSLSIDGNGYYQLTAEVEPASWRGKLQWESSDSSVAVVHDGLVTWTGRGTCTITATAGEVSGYCEVECGYVTVSSLSLSRRSMELNYGESDRLYAYASPSNWSGQVSWSSSDSSVAGVKDGAVWWNGEGECTITASADGKSASCRVRCNEPQVQSVEILEESISLDANQSYQISPLVTPSGWPGALSWSSSDPSVATVSDGLVRWVGAGQCTISVSAYGVGDSVTIHCEQSFLDGLWDDLFGPDGQSAEQPTEQSPAAGDGDEISITGAADEGE